MYPNQAFIVLFISQRPLEIGLAICDQGRKTMEITNQSKGMRFSELLAVWGPAFVGSTLGGLVIGILGVYYIDVSYPNSAFEHGAAVVGAFCGSLFSIPTGLLAGGVAGVFLYNFLSKRKSERPALPAGAVAFVIGALFSGVSLVPYGFIFFGLGHI